MERLTISLQPELAAEFDAYLRARGYSNRSEAMRDLIRERLEDERLKKDEDSPCVATLSYVYNHHELGLASRLTSAHHEHHDLSMSTMHVHLDHDHCLETVMLRGKARSVREFADAVIAERGVRHGRLHLIPVELEVDGHSHQHGAPPGDPDSPRHNHPHGEGTPPHVHSRPRT